MKTSTCFLCPETGCHHRNLPVLVHCNGCTCNDKQLFITPIPTAFLQNRKYDVKMIFGVDFHRKNLPVGCSFVYGNTTESKATAFSENVRILIAFGFFGFGGFCCSRMIEGEWWIDISRSFHLEEKESCLVNIFSPCKLSNEFSHNQASTFFVHALRLPCF